MTHIKMEWDFSHMRIRWDKVRHSMAMSDEEFDLIIQTILSCETREQCDLLLLNVSKMNMDRIAKYFKIRKNGCTLNELREKVIESTVGAKLRSDAILYAK